MTVVGDLDTPAVTVDLGIMEDNIRRVQTHLARHGIGNRPHIKTHKVPAIGKMQMQAGAMGITCQKIGEVEVFVEAEVADDILLTYNVLGRAKTDRLMALVPRAPKLTVVLDNEVVARELSEAGVRHKLDVRFLVECDTGFGRTGVQTPQAAFDLARQAASLPRMQFRGLMTFPNREHSRARVPGRGAPASLHCAEIPLPHRTSSRNRVFNDVMVVSSGTAT